MLIASCFYKKIYKKTKQYEFNHFLLKNIIIYMSFMSKITSKF